MSILNAIRTLPQKLRRVTSGGKFIKEIDGLRFIAIIPVLIQHYSERFGRNTAISFTEPPENTLTNFLVLRGFLGVYIFFVISGFILALPFAHYKLNNANKINLGQYYFRRLTRLEPPYFIWMSLLFIVFVIYKHNSFIDFLPHYLSTITYTHALVYGDWSPFNPPTWTLEIEVQFYIIAPFLSLLFFSIKDKVKRRIFNVLIVLALMTVQQYFKLYMFPFNLNILAHLQYFLIGFILADFYLCEWQNNTRNYFYDVAALLSFIGMFFVWSWDAEFHRRLMFLLTLFIFFYSMFKGRYSIRFLSNPWITAIGGMCYTIYLMHLPFAEFLILFTKKIHVTDSYIVNLAIQLLIFIPITLALSAVFFILFEKPFMDKNWPKQVSAKLKKIFSSKHNSMPA